MKIKILLASTCMMLVSTTYVDAKKPEKNYLPEAGDVTIGVNAIPFLNYLGNMFGKVQDNDINPAEIGGVPAFNKGVIPGLDNPTMSIFGKYFLTDKTAIRLNVGIGINSQTQSNYVQDDAALAEDPLSVDLVEDTYKYRNSGISVAVGYEWRRGGKRLQGFWGGQAILAYSNSKHFFGYGNAITELNQNPTSTNIWADADILIDENGNPIQTDANGYALCFSSTDSTVVKIDSGYIDLSGQETISTPAGSLHSVTIYGQYSGNTTNTTKEYTSSGTVIFSNKVSNVDVHAIGGGASGGFDRQDSSGYVGGIFCAGGAMGGSNVVLSAPFTSNTKYSLTVGKGGSAIVNTNSSTNPNNGSSSTFLTCTAQGGQGAGSGTGITGYPDEDRVQASANNGANSTYTRFNEGGEIFAGGDGGGAGWSNKPRPEEKGYGLGGTPNGGRGGWYYNRAATNGASGSRGGGGGGGTGIYGNTSGGSGAGGNGIVLVRYRY